MRPSRWLVVLVACAAVACTDASGVEAEVRETFEAYRAALDASDIPAAVSFYAADERFFWAEDGDIRYHSREEIAGSLEQLSRFGPVEVIYDEPVVTVLDGDTAMVFSRHQTSVGEGNRAFRFAGALTVLVIRTADGWKFLNGHTSTERRPGR